MGLVEGPGLQKWAITIVLGAIVALAGIAVSDNRSQLREQGADIVQIQREQFQQDKRIALLEFQYGLILSRLGSIDSKLDVPARKR